MTSVPVPPVLPVLPVPSGVRVTASAAGHRLPAGEPRGADPTARPAPPSPEGARA